MSANFHAPSLSSVGVIPIFNFTCVYFIRDLAEAINPLKCIRFEVGGVGSFNFGRIATHTDRLFIVSIIFIAPNCRNNKLNQATAPSFHVFFHYSLSGFKSRLLRASLNKNKYITHTVDKRSVFTASFTKIRFLVLHYTDIRKLKMSHINTGRRTEGQIQPPLQHSFKNDAIFIMLTWKYSFEFPRKIAYITQYPRNHYSYYSLSSLRIRSTSA